MVTYYDEISQDLKSWALAQPLFYTASAPTHGAHINLSPKGTPSTTLSIFSPTTCAYLDSTGSGAETIAHIYENGRVTLMFCSFWNSPRIMRFYCTGRVIEYDSPDFSPLLARMDKKHAMPTGTRAIILLTVHKVGTSCGFGVPVLRNGEMANTYAQNPVASEEHPEFLERGMLERWATNKVAAKELEGYHRDWNAKSLDGLPALRAARREGGERMLWWGDFKAGVKRARYERGGMVAGLMLGILIMLAVQMAGLNAWEYAEVAKEWWDQTLKEQLAALEGNQLVDIVKRSVGEAQGGVGRLWKS